MTTGDESTEIIGTGASAAIPADPSEMLVATAHPDILLPDGTPATAPSPHVRIYEESELAPASGTQDSGQVETLPDGSLSIPIFEEILVRRLVVRERIIVRKEVVSEQRRVGGELRKERVEVIPDAAVAARVDESDATGPA